VVCVLVAFGAAFLVARTTNNHGTAKAATVPHATVPAAATAPKPLATDSTLAQVYEPNLGTLKIEVVKRPKPHHHSKPRSSGSSSDSGAGSTDIPSTGSTEAPATTEPVEPTEPSTPAPSSSSSSGSSGSGSGTTVIGGSSSSKGGHGKTVIG
jgi:hypothetical protein